jgi:hypothetical protein
VLDEKMRAFCEDVQSLTNKKGWASVDCSGLKARASACFFVKKINQRVFYLLIYLHISGQNPHQNVQNALFSSGSGKYVTTYTTSYLQDRHILTFIISSYNKIFLKQF